MHCRVGRGAPVEGARREGLQYCRVGGRGYSSGCIAGGGESPVEGALQGGRRARSPVLQRAPATTGQEEGLQPAVYSRPAVHLPTFAVLLSPQLVWSSSPFNSCGSKGLKLQTT